MKPFQTLVFIISIFFLLIIIAWVFPENGINIGEGIHLKFASPKEYFQKDTIEYADISAILEKTSPGLSDDQIDSLFSLLSDSVENTGFQQNLLALTTNADSLRQISYALEFSGENPTSLYPLFRKIKNLNSRKRLIRILHYGDSQIEADRMSSFIRHKLQLTFGGSGCGTVPAVPLYNGQLSIRQEYSENWSRFTGFSESGKIPDDNRYGALFAFSRQNQPDTMNGSRNKTWLKFTSSPLSYLTSRVYSEASLYIEGEKEPVNIKVSQGEKTIDSLKLLPSQGLKKLKWRFADTPEELEFSFSGRGIAKIYGVSLDNSWGIALDNIPLRGSSGLVFSKTDTAFLSGMYKMMDVELVLLQFGGNVIPYMKDNFKAYERYFARELSVVRKILPGVPVIVIGPSDMSVKEGDKFITYPNLEGVRDAMRRATLESGFVFWDMYQAMGGRNSMPSWVSANPPLAATDYVHFNARGAKIIAEMFTEALLNEYTYWNLKIDSLKK